MAVTSRPIDSAGRPLKEDPPKAAPPRDGRGESGCILALGWVGMVLGVGAVGGVIWAINGGFSVLGLKVVAGAFNDAGRIAWAWLAAWTFRPPVALPGLAPDQPVIPWIGVAAASLLQISVVLLKLLRVRVPWWLAVAAMIFSVYDWASTFFGLGSMAWAKGLGAPLQAMLTTLITFSIEIVVAFLLRQLLGAARALRR